MRVYLFRHGETEWSLLGRHTGWTDLELTENGKREARCLGESLRGMKFDHVFSSPLKRAKETCEIAGYAQEMKVTPALLEWNYGDYEGLTSKEIWKEAPGWTIFNRDPPHGESSKEVGERADLFIQNLLLLKGNIAVFSSGHFTRVLAARWLRFPVSYGSKFALSTASKSILGFEHEELVILLWNDTSHLNRPE